MRRALLLAAMAALAVLALTAVPAYAGQPGGQPPGCKPSGEQPKKCDCPPAVDHHQRSIRDGQQCPTPPCPDQSSTLEPAGQHQMCCDGDNDPDDVGCPPVTPPGGGGGIVVTPEPPGANCTAGGVKIVASGQTFFVCNGVPGVQGPAGPAGPQGPPGPPGPQGPAGTPPTITVMQGPGPNQITITINGVPTVITIPGIPKPCVNTRKSATLGPLPHRFQGVKRVSVQVNGHRQVVPLSEQRTAKLNLTKVPCGVFPLVINDVPNTKAVTPVLRIWSLTGGNGLQRAGFPLPIPPIGLS